MATNDSALLDRIMSFDIDGGPAALTFERRLARECNWTPAFARRVVAEYRRFLYLAMTAGRAVTPSEEVDQAWHLHLVYTRSYWERLCRDVLPRPLHHEPTTGGRTEDARFDDAYRRTLESYRAAFGEAPPSDIWPPAEHRFGPASRFERVRTADCWILPRARLHRLLPALVLAALAPLGLGAGLVASGGGGLLCAVLGIGAVIVAVLGVAFRGEAARSPGAARRRDDSLGGCSTMHGCETTDGLWAGEHEFGTIQKRHDALQDVVNDHHHHHQHHDHHSAGGDAHAGDGGSGCSSSGCGGGCGGGGD